jgi:hypothetical protein
MKNRYRVEIFDEVKSNDVTLYFNEGVNREHLNELVFSNLRNFSGNVKAYVYDSLKKKKTVAMFLPIEIVNMNRPKITTAQELGLA